MKSFSRSILLSSITTILWAFSFSKTSERTPWSNVARSLGWAFPEIKIGMLGIAGELDHEYYELKEFPTASESRQIAATNILKVLGVGATRYWYALPYGVTKFLSMGNSLTGFTLRVLVSVWRRAVFPATRPLRIAFGTTEKALGELSTWAREKWKYIETKYKLQPGDSSGRNTMSG